MLLDGKSIVVTGGNTGIGKAIVLAVAAEGANVVDYIMILHEGTRAALVSGPDGHRFLVEEAVRGKGLYPAIKNLAEFLDASSQPDEGAR